MLIARMIILYLALIIPRIYGADLWVFPSDLEKKQEDKPKSEPFICPEDVALGWRVYAMIIEPGEAPHAIGYWDKLSLPQQDHVCKAWSRGYVGVKSEEYKFLLLAFGLHDLASAQSLHLHEYAEEIANKR
jgi:hypothetical protein